MSSEEMRSELEIFVNRGLREGWCGWPRHDSRGFCGSIRTGGTNRTYRTVRGSACSEKSYKFYPPCTSN